MHPARERGVAVQVGRPAPALDRAPAAARPDSTSVAHRRPGCARAASGSSRAGTARSPTPWATAARRTSSTVRLGRRSASARRARRRGSPARAGRRPARTGCCDRRRPARPAANRYSSAFLTSDQFQPQSRALDPTAARRRGRGPCDGARSRTSADQRRDRSRRRGGSPPHSWPRRGSARIRCCITGHSSTGT